MTFSNNQILSKVSAKLFDKNKLVVNTDGTIKPEDICLEWISESKSRIVFVNGKRKGKIGNESGYNAFNVYYKNQIISSIGHYKGYWYNSNEYYFNIYTNLGIAKLNFQLKGPDTSCLASWEEMYHSTDAKVFSNLKIHNNIMFNAKSSSIKNRIKVFIDSLDYQRMRLPGSDFKISNPRIIVNDRRCTAKSIKIHGSSSLIYSRKSLEFSLTADEKTYEIQGIESKGNLNSFVLISMSMDEYYINQRIALGILKKLDLFDLSFSFTELAINNETQGVYLIIEEPNDFILKRLNSAICIRKRYEYLTDSIINDIKPKTYKLNKSNQQKEAETYLERFSTIYNKVDFCSGITLKNALNELMVLEKYMKFLAFCYIICNHDYTDELFFYSLPYNKSEILFDFIPWDFDEIFGMSPHEGWTIRNNRIGNKLIFSSEDALDCKIALDSVLYREYLNILKETVQKLDTIVLQQIFTETYYDLVPYYMNLNIISMSKYDKYLKIYHIKDLSREINCKYDYLLKRLKIIERKIEKQLY